MAFGRTKTRANSRNSSRLRFGGEQLETRSLLTAMGFEAVVETTHNVDETVEVQTLEDADGSSSLLNSGGNDDAATRTDPYCNYNFSVNWGG